MRAAAGSRSYAEGHGRARARLPAEAGTPARTAPPSPRAPSSRATVARGAWPAAPGSPSGPAGDARRDGGAGRNIAAVPVRDRARPQGTVERDDRGAGRSARDHAHPANRTGRRRPAPSAGDLPGPGLRAAHVPVPRVGLGHALSRGLGAGGLASSGRGPGVVESPLPEHLVDDP